MELANRSNTSIQNTPFNPHVASKKITRMFFAQTIIVGILVFVVVYQTQVEPKNSERFQESYVIENLRGDSVDTLAAWHIAEGESFHVHVLDNGMVSDDKLTIIEDAILSTDYFELDDTLIHKDLVEGSKSRYFVGWKGAIESIEKNTFFKLPKKFHIHKTNMKDGHVIIKLTNFKDPDGNSAYTKSVVDKDPRQILKSTITIYEFDSLSQEGLGAIVRHEFGHSLGLAHSTDPDDLMHPIIQTSYPYISECDITALRNLYDGKLRGAICE